MLVDDNASPHRRLSPLHESTPRVSTVSSSDEEELLHSPTSPSISLFSEDKSVDVTSDVVPSTPSMSGMKPFVILNFCKHFVFQKTILLYSFLMAVHHHGLASD